MGSVVAVWFNNEEMKYVDGFRKNWEEKNKPMKIKASTMMKEIILKYIQKQKEIEDGGK